MRKTKFIEVLPDSDQGIIDILKNKKGDLPPGEILIIGIQTIYLGGLVTHYHGQDLSNNNEDPNDPYKLAK